MGSDTDIVVYGASGHGGSVGQWFTDNFFVPQGRCRVAAFIDDEMGGQGRTLQGKPVISFAEWREQYHDRPCFISIGSPTVKRRLVQRLTAAGARFESLYDGPFPGFPGVSVGAGTLIQAPVYVCPQTVIGDHVQIMPMTFIGHDVIIGDCTTICPSCNVSGHVIIEEDVFLGAGTTIINGCPERPIVVGKGAFVGAGSVVTKMVRPGAKVVGNPARSLRELAQGRRAGHGLGADAVVTPWRNA